MYVLNYWHSVADYAEWKKLFDSDPLDRKASGMRRVTIERPLGDEHTVVGHLEFDSLSEAEAFASRLEETWKNRGSGIVSDPGHNITEVLAREQYGSESGRRAA